MTSAITEMDAPDYFVDEQRRGPFRTFRHEHRSESIDGRTVMTGTAVESLGLGAYLKRLIEERNTFLKGQAESPQK